jgi:hypothetical protein
MRSLPMGLADRLKTGSKAHTSEHGRGKFAVYCRWAAFRLTGVADRLDDQEPEETAWLGKAVATGLALLVLMVGLGILWIWGRAEREKRERERKPAEEFLVPVNPR